MTDEFDKLKALIEEKLKQDLSPQLGYHGPSHTLDDVLPAADNLAMELGVSSENRLLVNTAALLHDTGYLSRYEDNEPLAADFARTLLPSFGFSGPQIDIIARIILKTAVPQNPETLLEQIVCDADLDSLGRTDYPRLSQSLRHELAVYGHPMETFDWLCRQREFLKNHRYFTVAARNKRDRGKQRNLKTVELALADYSNPK